MNDNNHEIVKGEHRFSFHGCGWTYFRIILMNMLLMIITLGIYAPWAMIRTRRYIYENMALGDRRFGYHAKGSDIFISGMLLMTVLFIISSTLAVTTVLSGILLISLACLLPLAIVKSMRYQAINTTFGNLRFRIDCPAGATYRIFVGLPLLMLMGAIAVFAFGLLFLREAELPFVYLYAIAMGGILLIVLTLTINAVIFSQYTQLVAKNSAMGTMNFSVILRTRQCLKLILLGQLIFVPYYITLLLTMAQYNSDAKSLVIDGNMETNLLSAMSSNSSIVMVVSQLLYFISLFTSIVFLKAALRRYVLKNLVLNGNVGFTVSFSLLLLFWQSLIFALVSIFSFGIAYPWALMRFVSFQARQVEVVGDVENLVFVDHLEKPETGLLASLLKGLIPFIPLF